MKALLITMFCLFVLRTGITLVELAYPEIRRKMLARDLVKPPVILPRLVVSIAFAWWIGHFLFSGTY